MPTIQVEAKVTVDDLLRAVDQFETAELDRFVDRLLALRARRHAPCLAREESDLLERINRGLPPDLQQRYAELIGKRQSESLTPEEHGELLRLTDQVEALEAARLQWLVELARIRQKPLGALLQELGIPASGHG
jgi:hypothetical protein